MGRKVSSKGVFDMEGTTEPVVAVIGHPIAGNPTQFALENGFAHAGVECRVLSFDLADEQLVSGLVGMEALNFRGVWVDRSRRAKVHQWLTTRLTNSSKVDVNSASEVSNAKTGSPTEPSEATDLPLDAMHRLASSADGKSGSSQEHRAGESWQPLRLRDAIWPSTLTQRLNESGYSLHGVLAIGEDDVRLSQIAEALKGTDWELERLKLDSVRSFEDIPSEHSHNVILVLDGVACETGLSKFKPSDELIVIDLAESWVPAELAAWEQYKMSVGRSCIGRLEIQAECLVKLTQTWFQRDVPADVFREALEEYLVV